MAMAKHLGLLHPKLHGGFHHFLQNLQLTSFFIHAFTFSRGKPQKHVFKSNDSARNPSTTFQILQIPSNHNKILFYTHKKNLSYNHNKNLWYNHHITGFHFGCRSFSSQNICQIETDTAMEIRRILSNTNTLEKPENTLNLMGITPSHSLVMSVLSGLKHEWRTALVFFRWVSENHADYTHSSEAYNNMIDMVGRNRCFEVMNKLFDEMRNPKNGQCMVTEETLNIMVRRYAAGNKADEAIETFYKRKEFGFELSTETFNGLVGALCSYGRIRCAEDLVEAKEDEFPPDIRTRNLVLNGWGSKFRFGMLKRYWKCYLKDNPNKDLFSYSILINSLVKCKELRQAIKVYEGMWKEGLIPHAGACNALINGLCKNRQIPQALGIFEEMKDRGCQPSLETYNILIKFVCFVGRIDEAYDLLHELETCKGFVPNMFTFHPLLKAAKSFDELQVLLDRMEKAGCNPDLDTFNLLLGRCIHWKMLNKARELWNAMKSSGIGPDQRSYMVVISWFIRKKRYREAYDYYKEMLEKGMFVDRKIMRKIGIVAEKLGKDKDGLPRAKTGVEEFECGADYSFERKRIVGNGVHGMRSRRTEESRRGADSSFARRRTGENRVHGDRNQMRSRRRLEESEDEADFSSKTRIIFGNKVSGGRHERRLRMIKEQMSRQDYDAEKREKVVNRVSERIERTEEAHIWRRNGTGEHEVGKAAEKNEFYCETKEEFNKLSEKYPHLSRGALMLFRKLNIRR